MSEKYKVDTIDDCINQLKDVENLIIKIHYKLYSIKEGGRWGANTVRTMRRQLRVSRGVCKASMDYLQGIKGGGVDFKNER